MTNPRRPFSEYGKTIKADGGIKARSTRGAIGESWWSKRFIAVMDKLTDPGRLGRGRSYARKGQVLSLALKPGEVSARVQGSRVVPYEIRITLSAYDESMWTRVEGALAAQALFAARLLAGEMPAEIEQVFARAGAPLFPTRAGDLHMECSCPDWGEPCKHAAAVIYLLAEAFDDDPFEILRWRGRDRTTLLANLRTLRGAEPTLDIAEPTPVTIGTSVALADMASPPLSEVTDRFWVAPVPLPARPPTLATDVDLILRQLPTPDATLGGRALVDQLREIYRANGN
jgi:uncharacterized Zn finger protein